MIAEDYLRTVAWELRDLPWKMRRDLVSELQEHLSELPPGTELGAQLGTPASTPSTCVLPRVSSGVAG